MCIGNHPQMVPRNTMVECGNLVIQTISKELHQIIKFWKIPPKGKVAVMGSKTTILHKTVKTQFGGIKVIGTFNEKDECSKSPPIVNRATMHAQRPAQAMVKIYIIPHAWLILKNAIVKFAIAPTFGGSSGKKFAIAPFSGELLDKAANGGHFA